MTLLSPYTSATKISFF